MPNQVSAVGHEAEYCAVGYGVKVAAVYLHVAGRPRVLGPPETNDIADYEVRLHTGGVGCPVVLNRWATCGEQLSGATQRWNGAPVCEVRACQYCSVGEVD